MLERESEFDFAGRVAEGMNSGIVLLMVLLFAIAGTLAYQSGEHRGYRRGLKDGMNIWKKQ